MTEREGSSWEKKERRRGRNVELDQFSKSSLSTPTIKERRSFSLISSVPLSHSRITPIYPPAVKAIESRARRRLLLLLLPPSTSPSTSRLLLSVSHLFSFLSVTYQTHRLGTSFGVFRRYSNTQLDQNTAQKEVVVGSSSPVLGSSRPRFPPPPAPHLLLCAISLSAAREDDGLVSNRRIGKRNLSRGSI